MNTLGGSIQDTSQSMEKPHTGIEKQRTVEWRGTSLFSFSRGFHETQQCSELLKNVTNEGLYDSIGELNICVLLDESFNLIVFLEGFDHFEALTLSSFPVS